jgi:hypothetical protein
MIFRIKLSSLADSIAMPLLKVMTHFSNDSMDSVTTYSGCLIDYKECPSGANYSLSS